MHNAIPQLKQRLNNLSELASRSELSIEDVKDIKDEMQLALTELERITDAYKED